MNLGPETEYVEYKRSTSELREGIASIAAILNKHGHGSLYFGVRDDGEVVGQDVSEKTLRDISQKIGELIEPDIYPQIERLETPEGKAYVRIGFSGFEMPYSCDGRYRIRRSDEDILMSHSKLTEMIRESENRSNPWDGRSSGLEVSAVDEETLRRYIKRGVACKRIPFDYTDPEDALSRLGLTSEDGMLTNAAVVCFVPSEGIMLRMGVFADQRRVHILDNQQVAGTLFSLVDAAELYILNNTRRAFIIDGTSLHRREVPEIPMDAVREALFNAFAHRQYEDDSAVQIDIFWDRIDIYSPGLFPEGFDPDSYLESGESVSKPRNKLIASTLYRSGDIEMYGTGLQRIKEVCGGAQVPFSVTQSEHGVHVSFARAEGVATDSSVTVPKKLVEGTSEVVPKSSEEFRSSSEEFRSSSEEFRSSSEVVPKSSEAALRNHDNLSSELSMSERAAYLFIARRGMARTAEIAAAIGLSKRGTLKVLNRLVDTDLIAAQGNTSGRAYRLKVVSPLQADKGAERWSVG